MRLWELLVRIAQFWDTVKAGHDSAVSRSSGVLSVKTPQFSSGEESRKVGGFPHKIAQFPRIV